MTFNSFSSLLRGKKERGSCLQTGSHHPFMVFPLSGPAVEPQSQQDEHVLIPWHHQRPTLATYQELKGGQETQLLSKQGEKQEKEVGKKQKGKKREKKTKKIKTRRL